MITLNENMVTAVNIAVIVIYLFFIFRGAKNGFLLQILSTFGTILAFLAAWRYCGFGSKYYHLYPERLNPIQDPEMLSKAVYTYLNEIAWFAALFIIVLLVFKILEKLVQGISDLPVIKEISGLLGGMLGGVAATIWIVVLTTIIRTPLFVNGEQTANNSLLGIISTTTGRVVEQFAGPITASETFGKLLEGVQELDGKDKEYLEDWLNEHGFEQLPEEKGNEQ